MPRNPHATDYVAGGSSTGLGVAVATGLVPLAIGADGGGSIRIPSALNGVFGISHVGAWEPLRGFVDGLGRARGADGVLDARPRPVLEAMGLPYPRDAQTDFAPALPPGSLSAPSGAA